MAKKNIATFLGPNKGLTIVGEHAVAYSGAIQAATSDITHLDFGSPVYQYIVGSITLTGPMKIDSVTDGGAAVAEIQFNGIELFNIKVETGQEDMPSQVTLPILIPPHTQVTIVVRSQYDTAGSTTSANIVGRIYDA